MKLPCCSKCDRLSDLILEPDSYDLWLDPGMKDVAAASELLKPYDARLMRCYPVSSPDQPRGERRRGMLRAVELAQVQNRLFS